jgi:hypothetical protein
LRQYGAEELAQRAPQLKALIQSDGFVQAAAVSDLLAHI